MVFITLETRLTIAPNDSIIHSRLAYEFINNLSVRLVLIHYKFVVCKVEVTDWELCDDVVDDAVVNRIKRFISF